MQPSSVEKNDQESATAPLLPENNTSQTELTSSKSPIDTKCSLRTLFTSGGKIDQLQADIFRLHTVICCSITQLFLNCGLIGCFVYFKHSNPFVGATFAIGCLTPFFNLLVNFIIVVWRRGKMDDIGTDSDSQCGLKTLLTAPWSHLLGDLWDTLLALIWAALRPFFRLSCTKAPLVGFLLLEAVLVTGTASRVPCLPILFSPPIMTWFYPAVSTSFTLYALVALAVHSRPAPLDPENTQHTNANVQNDAGEQNNNETNETNETGTSELSEDRILDLKDIMTILTMGLMLDLTMMVASENWTQFAGGAVAEVCNSLCMIFGFTLAQRWRA